MEYSRLPNHVGRKENNPFSSKEDNWIIRDFMELLYKQVLELVRASIHNEDYLPSKAISWEDMLHILKVGSLTGIAYSTIMKLPENIGPSDDVKIFLKNLVMQRGFLQLISFQELRRVITEAEQKGFHPIPFKGISLANLYPEPNMRFSSDADILIPPEESLGMEKLLLELGYVNVPSSSKDHVPVYKINDKEHMHVLAIELHDCLWEDYTGVQADLLESLNLSAPESLINIDACNVPITTLGYEEHLIYQIFHIVKHFFFERLPLRYLADLTLYVNAYHEKMDCEHFWSVMKLLKYDLFCDSIFKICVQYLDMTDAFLSEDYKNYHVNDNLLTTIMNEHMPDDHKVRAWASAPSLAPYLMRNTKVDVSSISHFRQKYFPMPSELKEKFNYAKKCKILLPLAWLHRILGAISYSKYCKTHGSSAKNAYEKIDQRLQMMNDFNMLDTK